MKAPSTKISCRYIGIRKKTKKIFKEENKNSFNRIRQITIMKEHGTVGFD